MRIFTFAIVSLATIFIFHGPPLRGNDWQYYGSVPIYPGTPYNSIYLGLNENYEPEMLNMIAKFAETNGIQKCKDFPMNYSGPTLAAYAGNHIAIFIRSYPTTMCITYHNRELNFGGSLDFTHWPANGSVESNGDHNLRMPFTGIISISPFGTNYSLQEFRQVSDGLASTLHSAFTNRSVYIFTSNTNKP